MSMPSIPRGILTEQELPEPYNDCQCHCHKIPGCKHIMPCCGPGINDTIPSRIELSRDEKLNE